VLDVAKQVQVREVAVPLVQVEAVADEELVGDGEADVPDGQVLDEAPVRTVEERDRGERARGAELERAAEVVERQARVDDVLDDQDVAPLDRGVEVLEEPDRRASAGLVGAVAGELDEVDVVDDRKRAAEVDEEDDARLQRRDEERLPAGIVLPDLGAELTDPRGDLRGREVDVADPSIGGLLVETGYEASFSPYRWPSRSMSRL
jgi:hypothetical protein